MAAAVAVTVVLGAVTTGSYRPEKDSWLGIFAFWLRGQQQATNRDNSLLLPIELAAPIQLKFCCNHSVQVRQQQDSQALLGNG